MNEIHIRPATSADLPLLLEFEQGVIAAERPFDPTIRPHPTRYYDLRGMLTDPDVCLLVAEQQQQLVGSGYARIKEAKPFNRHSHYAYLGFMYVLPSFRGRGINGLLIDALKQWALSKGLHEMRLEVYYDNAAAIRAYEKAGFTKHMIEMRIPI